MLVAVATATIAGCGLSLSVTLVSVRLDAMGFSARAIGLNTAAAGIATLLCAPLIPAIARRVGVARTLFAALVGGGIALLGFTLTDDYAAWVALRFAVSATVTVLFVLSEYWIGTAAARHRRGLTIGFYATSLGVGFAAGPLLLRIVGTQGDLPFIAGAGLFWLATVPLVSGGRRAPGLIEAGGAPFPRFFLDAPIAMMAGLLHGAIEVAGIGLLPIYALRAGAGVTHSTLFTSLFVLGGCTMQVPLGLVSDRIDRRKLLIALAGLGLAGALLLAVLDLSTTLLFEAVLFLWAALVGGFYPVGLAQLSATYRNGATAGANAAFVMSYSLGMLVGPPLVGLGLDLLPPGGFFLAMAAMIAAYLLVAGSVLLFPTDPREPVPGGKVRGVP